MTAYSFTFPTDPEAVMLAGDWHGNANRATEVVRLAGQAGITTLLHLGDFGFWVPGDYTDRYLDAVERECAENGVTLMWVDGNHECFPALYGVPVNDRGVRVVRDNIAHLPRGFRWTWHNKTWMALGGAHSVDSHMRKEGVSVWDQEHLTEDEVTKAVNGGTVDVMVCHDCPDDVHIPDLPSDTFPTYQIYRAEEHRHLLGRVVDEVRPTALYHGHYHRRYAAHRPLVGGGRTHIIGLGDDGGNLHDNIMVLELKNVHVQ